MHSVDKIAFLGQPICRRLFLSQCRPIAMDSSTRGSRGYVASFSPGTSRGRGPGRGRGRFQGRGRGRGYGNPRGRGRGRGRGQGGYLGSSSVRFTPVEPGFSFFKPSFVEDPWADLNKKEEPVQTNPEEIPLIGLEVLEDQLPPEQDSTVSVTTEGDSKQE